MASEMSGMDSLVPQGAGPFIGADVKIAAHAHHPDDHRIAQRAIRSLGCDLQLVGFSDPVWFIACPYGLWVSSHGISSALMVRRSSIAR